MIKAIGRRLDGYDLMGPRVRGLDGEWATRIIRSSTTEFDGQVSVKERC